MRRTSPASGRSDAGGCSAEYAWLNQPGRIASRSSSFADGFRGRAPYAGVAVVAECSIEDAECAVSAVAQVRDAFADGVAYGVDEVLGDAFDHLRTARRGTGHEGCSAAAVAVLGSKAYVASTGTCHAFMADPGSEGSIDLDIGGSADGSVVREVLLREGQAIVLVTSSLRKLMGSTAAAKYTTGCSEPLGACLRTLVTETRIRFRKTGGSVAAMRIGRESAGLPRKPLVLAGTAALLIILAALVLPGLLRGSSDTASPDSSTVPDGPAIVMPLGRDTVPETSIEEPLPDPVGVLFIAPSAMGLDTLPGLAPTVSGVAPDPRWEKASSGIYYVAGHAPSDSLARWMSVQTATAELPLVPVSSVVIVRQNEISPFAVWLRGLDPEDAASTAVVVETSSSVAGGADWIRDFALFANGDREREHIPSSFTGSPPAGVPALPDSSGYSIIVVP